MTQKFNGCDDKIDEQVGSKVAANVATATYDAVSNNDIEIVNNLSKPLDDKKWIYSTECYYI